jgi:heptosyltransferase II
MRIAIFLPNWIGDAVMATPAIAAIARRHPTASLLAVGRPYVKPVIDEAPWFDGFLPMNRGVGAALQVARELRTWRTDTAVLFPNSFRVAAVALLAGCKNRIGFARYGRGLFLTDRLHPARRGDGTFLPTPILRDYNRIAGLLDAEATDRMELFTSPADDENAQAVLKKLGIGPQERVVGLNPGAAFGASKFWPTEHFIKLARELADRDGVRVVILCGPAERGIAQTIAQGANRPGVVSLAEAPLSLALTKSIVKRLELLVTTDSGPRHFAAALDVPVVTLFGPTHISWTETFYPRAIHLQKTVPCGPCQLRTCPTDHRCMRELMPEDVYRAAETLLKRGQRHAG